MKILKNLPKPIKNVLKIIMFPFIFLWIAISVVILKIGDGIHWLGDDMTGFRAGKMDF